MLLAALLTMPMVAMGAEKSAPPSQPDFGPGGLTASYDVVRAVMFGQEPTGFWLFEPERLVDGKRTGPSEAVPLIIFLHGFSAVDPIAYRGWIDHLVLRGAVVVFPLFQSSNILKTSFSDFLVNTVTGVKAAIAVLQSGLRTPVDLDRVAVVGHSVGGVLTANLAAVAERVGVPEPAALMAVEPGGCRDCGAGPSDIGLPLLDLSPIPNSTRMLVLIGDRDSVVGDGAARMIWSGTSQIPNDQRDCLILQSDDWGSPALVANHFAPEAGVPWSDLDALDWHGLWKPFDMLLSCAFAGTGCTTGMNGGAAQPNMGTWSEGRPVAKTQHSDSPPPLD